MKKSINTLRFLGLDMINKANSGHPGIVLGAAPILYTLFTKHLKVTPEDDQWLNRDRFIFAAGHGTGLYYPILHLSGFDVTLDDLKEFRQLGSKTPGHPEYKHTKGIDATSGPLGQGIPTAIGMAIAETYLSEKLNKDDITLIDHYTYALCGDGDLQEGITQEAMSLAGHLKLSKLIVLYDSNDIQLDGPVSMANSENVKAKYEAMNWSVLLVEDGNDVEAINQAIIQAKALETPTLIEIKTKIGYGSHLEGDSASHGAPIGIEQTNKMKEQWSHELTQFEVSAEVYDDFKVNVIERGNKSFYQWTTELDRYIKEYPESSELLKSIMDDHYFIDFTNVFEKKDIGYKEASRATGGSILTRMMQHDSRIIGGSADLTKSTKAKGLEDYTIQNRAGRNINFGVREHAMAAIVNGLNLSGLKGFSGGFFVFSDYMKPSMRMAALMNIPSTYIFTHDSVAVGEDGPTHEPIEQLAMLRSMPNMEVIRPCDANETQMAFHYAFSKSHTPTSIVLSRQNLEVKRNISYEAFMKGAYVIHDVSNPDAMIIATGSEVSLAIEAAEALTGVRNIRVVSMPSQEMFDRQSDDYQASIMNVDCPVIALEAASSFGWYKYADYVYSIDTFGASGDGTTVMDHFGFSKVKLIGAINQILT
jgi:transketolase